MLGTRVTTDFIIAIVLTTGMGAVAWVLASGLPFIGIDDAAITRSYAENIANGHGYVYNVGSERVEGATSALWVIVLTLAYSLISSPEFLIIGICGLITAGTVLIGLRYVRNLAFWLDVDERVTVSVFLLCLAASPGFFMWSIWTMMEVGLWSFLVLALVFNLSILAEEKHHRAPGFALLCIAFTMSLVRPEGIAVVLGLSVFTALIRWSLWRVALAASAAAIVSFTSVTLLRLWYFGYPFPNTFYAKVSSDKLQGIKDGLKYFFDFFHNSPFAAVFVVLWLGAAGWGLSQLSSRRRGVVPVLIGAAAVVALLSIYIVLGGDHFVLWRFFQPASPLLPVVLALLIGLAAKGVRKLSEPFTLGAFPVAVAAIVVMLASWTHYYQERFDIVKEFRLVQQGIGFGEMLNTVSPRPSIGVGPAGGIALRYDGEILDLLGLNWTVMAHANPIKVGFRNHASFDLETFWAFQPDVLSTFNRACSFGQNPSYWITDDDGFNDLFEIQRFRDAYLPVSFVEGDQCWSGFATPDWLAKTEDKSQVVTFSWSDVEFKR